MYDVSCEWEEMTRPERPDPYSWPCPDCSHEARDHTGMFKHIKKSTDGCLLCDCSNPRTSITPKPDGCLDARILDDGRLATLYPLIFGIKILLGEPADKTGGNEWYDWVERDVGQASWDSWDGYGEPSDWNRHQLGNNEMERRFVSLSSRILADTYRTMKQGDSGEDVSDIRRALHAKGYTSYSISSESVFDSPLANTVRKFQSDKGLAPDGIVGPDTAREIFNI